MRHERPIRAGLLLLATPQAAIGAWALFAPHSFHENFPTHAKHWISTLGAYNPHLTTDFGSLSLALAAMLLAGAWFMERRLVRVVLGAWLIWAVGHFVYHLGNLAPLSDADAITNVVTLGGSVVLVVVMLWLSRSPQPRGAAEPSAGALGRIDPARPRGLVRRGAYMYSRRRYGQVIAPVGVFAHHPRILLGYGAIESAFENSTRVDARLKLLVEIKAALVAGCEWCIDFGTAIGQGIGLTPEELEDLRRYRESDRFTEVEKLALDYAVAISSTPVNVTDEMFARLREHFDEPQLVELTTAAAIENFRARFNWAFGIGRQGFARDGVCLLPERPAEAGPAGAPA